MRESCALEIHRISSGYLFRVIGRGTMHASPTVQKFICGAIEDGSGVVLDLSACDYLDSTFQGCLVLLHQRGREHAGTFAVHAKEPVRRKLLGRVQLQNVLAFVDDLPERMGEAVTLDISDTERSEFCRHLLETHQQLAELGGAAASKFRAIAAQMAEELGGIS